MGNIVHLVYNVKRRLGGEVVVMKNQRKSTTIGLVNKKAQLFTWHLLVDFYKYIDLGLEVEWLAKSIFCSFCETIKAFYDLGFGTLVSKIRLETWKMLPLSNLIHCLNDFVLMWKVDLHTKSVPPPVMHILNVMVSLCSKYHAIIIHQKILD